MKQFDVIFIGSGHACWHGALILKMAGKNVALVERELLGGTCTNYGCDAKILLDSPFELKEALNRYEGIGLRNGADIDWTSLMHYKKQLIGSLPNALDGIFKSFGFTIIRGEAAFIDANTIQVDNEKYKAKYFVIGTGQDYIPLKVKGTEYCHDSRDFLSLDVIPEHIAFAGSGIISMELASICLSLGKKVDIISAGKTALENYPQKYVKKIVEKMKSQGANFIFGAQIDEIQKISESEYLLKGPNGLFVSANYILTAIGRRANTEGLGLKKIGIRFSERGIAVDNHLRTSVKNIYASGDVIDKKIPKLTPTAEFESNYIAVDILNPINKAIRYPVIPNLVFTLPRIAQVGVTEAEAEKSPSQYRVEEIPFGESMSWMNKAEREAHITFIFDRDNHLAGASVMSDDAGSYIDVLTLIINKKLDARDLGGMIFSFPTPTYGLISSLIPLFMNNKKFSLLKNS